MQDKWAWLQRWVEDLGQAGVEALENIERQTRNITPLQLRPLLRPLVTKAARRALLPAMRRPGVLVSHLGNPASEALKEQWVQWHWETNPDIHPNRSMLRPSDDLRSIGSFEGHTGRMDYTIGGRFRAALVTQIGVHVSSVCAMC